MLLLNEAHSTNDPTVSLGYGVCTGAHKTLQLFHQLRRRHHSSRVVLRHIDQSRWHGFPT